MKIEVCSLADGAWYEVNTYECDIKWAMGQPCLLMKYADFSHDDAELFRIENFFQKRFRIPFEVAEEGDDGFQENEQVVGFAQSDTEAKWFDAEVVRVKRYKGDVLVIVEWRNAIYMLLFGTPKTRVLSVKKGEVGRPFEYLDPLEHPVLKEWVEAIHELAGYTSELVVEKDRTIVQMAKPLISKIVDMPMENYAPLSYVKPPQNKRQKTTGNDLPTQSTKEPRINPPEECSFSEITLMDQTE